jgi:hypothetical protein
MFRKYTIHKTHMFINSPECLPTVKRNMSKRQAACFLQKIETCADAMLLEEQSGGTVRGQHARVESDVTRIRAALFF